MNARFAAVALTSCLSGVHASQLFTMPSLMSVVAANARSTTPIASDERFPAADAKPAQAAQIVDPAPANEAAQAADAPAVAEAMDAREAINVSQSVDTPQTAEAPEVPLATDAPELADALETADSSSFTSSSTAATTPAVEPVSPEISRTVAARDDSQASDLKQTDLKHTTFKLASADPSEVLIAEPSSTQPVSADLPKQKPEQTTPAVDTVEVLDECFVVDICVDRYLWALYQRAPKEDKMRVSERRAVTIKKKGKMVSVTRTFSRLVDENFAWKDEAASTKSSMPMQDYVIGGMDRGFKLKLFHTLHAAEAAGLSPGITSAFRDDYRQSIASGLKAANDKSYHGGSFRGGYGHGLAADIVSVKGMTRAERSAATEALWRWVDAHGKEFGVGRPYLSYDPPHVGPVDGKEYVSRRGGDKARQAHADMEKPSRPAARHAHGAARHAKTVASARVNGIRSARTRAGRTA